MVLTALVVSAALAACGGSDGDSSGEEAAAGCGETPDTPRTTLTYELESASADDLAATAEVICDRLEALDADGKVATEGDDRLVLTLAGRASEQIASAPTSQGLIYFYAFEPNVVPVPGSGLSQGEVTPADLPDQAQNEYDAVELASEQQQGECGEAGCASPDPGFYLFERSSREYVAGPLPSRSELLGLDEAKAIAASDRAVFEVPVGTIVVEDQSPTGEGGSERYFVLRDDPALSGADITDPEQSIDPNNQPNVTFDFTDEGREKFAALTGEIAQKGAAAGEPYSFAIVLDGVIVSRPIIDFNENPDGIDGSDGAQISGGLTITEAQQLAEYLATGALPVPLRLISVEVEE